MISSVRRRMPAARSEDGLSLIEVLVAMMIFAFISTGVIYTMISVASVGRDSRARQVATNLASGEIDLARDTKDIFAVVDADRAPQVFNGDSFHVHVDAQWVSDPNLDFTCGGAGAGAGGALRYKRVNVTVTWDNMRSSTEPVRADTVIGPDEQINDPAKGTILVSVLNGAGTGNPNVAVSVSPTVPSVINPTDSQGCTYIMRVAPGTYTVSVSKTGYVDSNHNATASQSVSVTAGKTASVNFQYDSAATYRAVMSPAWVPPAGVTLRFPTNLKTTFWNTYGRYPRTPTSGAGSMTPQFKLHPYSTGYQAYAGECDAADPGLWPDVNAAGQDWAGVRADAAAATPGGTVDVGVPVGVVTIAGGGTGTYLKAVSQNVGIAGLAECPSTVVYEYGSVLGAGPTTIALPYGKWFLYRGGTAAFTPGTPIGSGSLTLVQPAAPTMANVAASGLVTLDPRQVVVP